MSSRPLDGQVAQWKSCRLTVWTANHLDTILRGEVSELEEEDGEVVDEEQGVDQGESELNNVLVKNLCSVLQQVDAVEQPETDDKDEDEGGGHGPEDKDTGK